MSQNPVLSARQGEELLRRVSPPPEIEQRAIPEGTVRETRYLRGQIAKHGRNEGWVKVTVTQAMALAMLAMMARNRKVRRSWVDRLKGMMEEGRFYSINNGLAFDWNGQLRDGQHRLIAISELGLTVQLWALFGMDPAAFDAIDVGAKRRAKEFLDLDDVKYSDLVASVVRFKARIEAGEPVILDEQAVHRTGLVLAQTDDVLIRAIAAAGALRRHSSKAFSRIPESSLVLAYWLIAKNAKRALSLDQFWDRLVDGTGLTPGDPVLRLRNRLSARSAQTGKQRQQYLAQTEVAAWTILAWNAWATKTTVTLRWSETHQLPLVK